MIIRFLIVDDEPPAIMLLKSFIERTPGCEIAAAETDPVIAVEKMNNGLIKADAAFLDVEMPKKTGLEVKTLINIPVIFTTGHKEFASAAFDLDAVDYLTKPFDYERFCRAIKKLREKIAILHPDKNNDLTSIKISGKGNKAYFVLDDVYSIESLNGKLLFKVNDDVYSTSYAIEHIIKQLGSRNFIRVHRSFVVNMNKIKEVKNKRVKLKDGQEIPIGEGYEKAFFETFDPGLLFD